MNPFWFLPLDEMNDDGSDLPGGDAADPTPPADPAAPAAKVTDPAEPPATPQDWPSDWRAKLSPDGKHAKTLDRFASPNALMDSYMSLRQKLDSGELRANTPFPQDGSEEDQAAWRKAHGIPESHEGYDLKFDDGLVIGDQDKPLIEEFVKSMHGTNATKEQVENAVKWYYQRQEQNLAEQEERDEKFLHESEDTLRAEWGPEYRTNVNMIRGLIDTMPEGVRDLFVNARLGDGNALINHPDMARWLVHNARTINPVATVVPNAGANLASAIEDEIGSIEKVMRENRAEYNRNEKMQARLRELYAARERAK